MLPFLPAQSTPYFFLCRSPPLLFFRSHVMHSQVKKINWMSFFLTFMWSFVLLLSGGRLTSSVLSRWWVDLLKPLRLRREELFFSSWGKRDSYWVCSGTRSPGLLAYWVSLDYINVVYFFWGEDWMGWTVFRASKNSVLRSYTKECEMNEWVSGRHVGCHPSAAGIRCACEPALWSTSLSHACKSCGTMFFCNLLIETNQTKQSKQTLTQPTQISPVIYLSLSNSNSLSCSPVPPPLTCVGYTIDLNGLFGSGQQ